MKRVDELKGRRIERRVLMSLTIVLVFIIVFFWNASFIVRLSSTLACFILFYLVNDFFKIGFKKLDYVYFMIICITSFLLSPLFFIFPNYDKILHFFLPLITAYLVFHCIDKLDIKLRWKLLFTFSIVVAIIGVFEIIEYTLDYFLNMKLQGVFLRDSYGLERLKVITDPLDDTMIDMVFGTIGTALYCIYKRIKKN